MNYVVVSILETTARLSDINTSCGSDGINIGIVNGIDDTINDRINDTINDRINDRRNGDKSAEAMWNGGNRKLSYD